MIKTVAYFPSQCALNSQPVMAAVLHSLKQEGIRAQENSMDSDAVIIWSVLFAGRMSGNQSVYEHYRNQNKPVIIIDVGALYRGETWKIALNHVTADGYYGHQERLDVDRPRKLGINIALNLTRNPNIVIAAQHKNSLQMAGIVMEDWVVKTIAQLRTVTDRPIVVRPHPRCPLQSFNHDNSVTIDRPRKLIDTYDSYNLAFDCHAMVNYNSGPGIQAALAGTRPIVDVSSLAHSVSIQLEHIDQPYDVDRDHWLIEICHTEYTLKEIEKGLWLQRLCLV